MTAAVRLSHKGVIYRFLRFTQAGDWSLVVSWDRDLVPNDVVHHFSTLDLRPVLQDTPDDQMKVTYHTTGQVNFHGMVSRAPAYFDPLPEIKATRAFLGISIPDVMRLNPLELPRSNDLILPIEEGLGGVRLTFLLAVCRRDAPNEAGQLFRLDYDIFSVVGLAAAPPPVPAELTDRFMYFAFDGPLNARSMTKNGAMLAYHQRKSGQGLGIYPPNGEGVYTLFSAVEMRVVPTVQIEFSDSKYRIEVLHDRARPMLIPFRIYDRDRLVKRADLLPLIRNVVLNARMPDPIRP